MCNVRNAFVKKRRDAKRRGIPFELSFEEFSDLYKIKKCAYTGIHLKHNTNGTPLWKRFSLDRINNDVGYRKDNIAVCSAYVNCVKGDIDSSKFKVKIRVRVEDTKTEILTRERSGDKIRRKLVAI